MKKNSSKFPLINNQRYCKKCNSYKDQIEFYQLNTYECKSCVKKRGSNWVINNRVRKNNVVKKWLKDNPEKARLRTLKSRCKRFGITVETYYQMIKDQDGKCAICKTDKCFIDSPGSKVGTKAWNIDHNHKTGEVRGILCWHCNVTIGMAKENIDTLLSAAQYLKNNGYKTETINV